MTARSRRQGTSRLVRAGSASAARTPFVLLVVVLLSSGLVTLLLLNSAINQGAFQLSKLKQQTKTNTDQEQQLQQEVSRLSAPDALEQRARQLGMVPGGNPAFLSSGGKVRGVPAPPSSSATPQLGMRSPADAYAPPAPVPSDAPAPAEEPADALTDSTTATTAGTGTGAGTSAGTRAGTRTGTGTGASAVETTGR